MEALYTRFTLGREGFNFELEAIHTRPLNFTLLMRGGLPGKQGTTNRNAIHSDNGAVAQWPKKKKIKKKKKKAGALIPRGPGPDRAPGPGIWT